MNSPITSAQKGAFLAMAKIDLDPTETAEWPQSFLSLVEAHGAPRARQNLDELVRLGHEQR